MAVLRGEWEDVASVELQAVMKRYRVFGLWDDAWWELWEGRNHRGASPENVINRIREDLLRNGEEQYEAIAVVPADAFTVGPTRETE